MKTNTQPSIWRNFMIMLLGFSLMINGLFIYKINQDKAIIQTNGSTVRSELEKDYQSRLATLTKEKETLTKENKDLKELEKDPLDQETEESIEEVPDSQEEAAKRSQEFVNGYLNFSDMYDEKRMTTLQEVATQDVVDRLVPKIDQGLSEQGEVDQTIAIQSQVDKSSIYLGNYDSDTQRIEAICDVEYTTTVDGKETKTHNLFTLQLEKMNGQFMVTSFSYHSII